MDSQSSVISYPYNQKDMSILMWVNMLMPAEHYSTHVTHFPGSNAIEEWGSLHGNFFITFKVYVDRQEVARVHTPFTDERGYLQVNFDQMLEFIPADKKGIVIGEYHHHKQIFPELYFSHTHRASGVSVSYPSQLFMGDTIYPLHKTELENSLIWPGAPVSQQTEVSLIILNPYKLSSLFQLHLFMPDGAKIQSKPFKVQGLSWEQIVIEEMFPDYCAVQRKDAQAYSFCITSQYKVPALVAFKDKSTGALTTIDHLHRYCLV